MMKINSKRNIVFAASLSVLQIIGTIPVTLASEELNAGVSQSVEDMRAKRIEEQKARMSERQANADQRQSDRQANREEHQANRREASCERMTTMGADHSRLFSERKSQFDQKLGDRATLFDERRDSNDAKLNDSREKQDERRGEMYMRLEEKATTDVQKEAVKVFQKTVEKAVTDRRSVVNAAIDSFRSDVDKLVSTKKTTVTDAAEIFQESSKQAFEKAKTDCASGTDPKIVRDALTASLKDARGKLQESRQSFEGLGNSISALAGAKKTAIDKAVQDFKTTMEKARTDLKASFQE